MNSWVVTATGNNDKNKETAKWTNKEIISKAIDSLNRMLKLKEVPWKGENEVFNIIIKPVACVQYACEITKMNKTKL